MKLKRLTALLAVLSMAVVCSWAYRADTLVVKSDNIPEPMKVCVITPGTGQLPAGLPAVYLLNGYGGDYRDWNHHDIPMGEYADRYNIVVVMPSGMDSWYWDAPANPSMKMETFFINDLVPLIRQKYNVSTEASQNAISGLSMGGHGAMWLGMRHPDVWGNIGSISGGLDIRPFAGKWKMNKALGSMEKYPARWNRYTVATHVDRLKANAAAGQKIIFDCGTADFFHDVNNALHQKLVAEKVPHDYISRPGNHSWNYWRNSIKYQLLFFSENFKAAQK